jgi:hypothetical protein
MNQPLTANEQTQAVERAKLAAPSTGASVTASPADGDVIEALRATVAFLSNKDGAGFGTTRMDGSDFFFLANKLNDQVKAALSRFEASQPAAETAPDAGLYQLDAGLYQLIDELLAAAEAWHYENDQWTGAMDGSSTPPDSTRVKDARANLTALFRATADALRQAEVALRYCIQVFPSRGGTDDENSACSEAIRALDACRAALSRAGGRV